jgi:predicted ATPase
VKGEPAFVGRVGELAALAGGLAAARDGQSQLWLIAGEAGIGKTRLVQEVARRASVAGMRVLWGRCWEGEGAPAFWPWQQVVRGGAQGRTSALVRRLGAAGSEGFAARTRRGPTNASGREGVFREPGFREPGSRFRLFEAVAAWLRKASRRDPLVIILEDLHWSDVPSVRLLRFVARHALVTHSLFLATCRSGEVARGEPLSLALAELAREGRGLRLEGFGPDDTAAFIAATAGFTATPSLVDTIQRRTEGNPLFVQEIVELLQESSGKWEADAVARLPLVSGLRAAIHGRLTRLSEACRRTLTVAAVVGTEFDLDLVHRAMGVAESALSRPIDEAAAGQIVRRLDPRGRCYRFTHALLRETLYEDLGNSERVAWHERIADALEEDLASERNGSPLAALAHHFSCGARAEDGLKAADYSTRAADEARRLLAFEEAAALYSQALAALARLSSTAATASERRQRECELLLALGEVQMAAAQVSDARVSFARAAELARALEAPWLLARAALGFAGGADVSPHVAVDAVRLLQEALARAGDSSPALRAALMARLAVTASFSDGPERAAVLSAAALVEAERARNAATLASVLGARRYVLLGPDDHAERQLLTARLATLAETLDDPEVRGGAEFWRLLDALERGNGAAVDTHLARYTRLAENTRQPFLVWRSRVLHAMRLLLSGRFADAEEAIEAARAASDEVQTPNAFLVYGAQMLDLRLQQGRVSELQERAEQFAAANASVPAVACGIALVRARLEQRDAAAADLALFVDASDPGLPRDGLWLGAVNALAHVAVLLDDRAAASRLYEWLSPYAGMSIVIGFGDLCHGAVARALGLLAATLERRDEAAAHFEAALKTNRALGARALVAHVESEYAQMLLSAPGAGGLTHARALLCDAAATYHALGMSAFRVPASELQARASRTKRVHPTGQTKPATGSVPDNLFQRQKDFWLIAYEESQARVRDRRGLHYIAALLREPGREFHVADLVALWSLPPPGGGPVRRRAATVVAVPDAQARAAYRARLSDLESEAHEAERSNDPLRAHAARAELELLQLELARRYRFDGDARTRNPDIERMRKAVSKCIRLAIGGVNAAHPALGRHLRASLRTGTFCSYVPERPTPWQVEMSPEGVRAHDSV